MYNETFDETPSPDTEQELGNMGLAPVPVHNMQVDPVKLPDPVPAPQQITPAQARIEAVAGLLHKAYEKAGEVPITPEEAQKLQAQFSDHDFYRGAGGKENLIYIQHAALRERLNTVLGIGKWALVVRNKTVEPFTYWNKTTRCNEEAARVYVEGVLVIRGAYAAEALGDMVYYPKNQQTNYGDAYEGAKSACLRRCAKDLGVGLQAWDKSWCDGWMQRHPLGQPRPESCPIPKPAVAKPAPTPAPAPATKEKPAEEKEPTEAFKKRWMELLKPIAPAALEYYIKTGRLLSTEDLNDLPLRFVPKTKDEADKMLHAIQAFMDGDSAPDQEVPPKPSKPAKASSALCITGWLKHVTKKETKRPGSFRYGVLITEMRAQKEGGTWLNTFSDTDGAKAEGLKGEKVIAWYTEGEYGNDMIEDGIQHADDV